MNKYLRFRPAKLEDLHAIITLLADDQLGMTREISSPQIEQCYLDAFSRIITDPNQFLMVVTEHDVIVGTCHLTLMPSLTFKGSTRMQIEAVRIEKNHRHKGIGEWMIREAIKIAKTHGASIIQLTTNIERPKAKRFYEKLEFQPTHVGLKLFLEKN